MKSIIITTSDGNKSAMNFDELINRLKKEPPDDTEIIFDGTNKLGEYIAQHISEMFDNVKIMKPNTEMYGARARYILNYEMLRYASRNDYRIIVYANDSVAYHLRSICDTYTDKRQVDPSCIPF